MATCPEAAVQQVVEIQIISEQAVAAVQAIAAQPVVAVQAVPVVAARAPEQAVEWATVQAALVQLIA